MPSQTLTDPRAWTAVTLDDRAAWYYRLPEACWSAFKEVQRDRNLAPAEIIGTRLSPSSRRACQTALQPVRAALETGRGFAIVESPPSEHLAPADATLLYWIVGQGLGEPFAQNVQGTLLYDVRDMGKDLTQGARFSVTNYESSFHTDNSFGADVLDYVGLLCLQTAKSGGRSQVVSGLAVHEALGTRHPDAVTTLSRPFHVDRRGGVREGETPTVQFPVLESKGRELVVRYLRYWIEAGHDKVGQPLTAAQKTALNLLDETLNRRDLRAEFDLKPGDMYFINNRWILHNRTAFEDHADMDRRRHLVRLWLKAE